MFYCLNNFYNDKNNNYNNNNNRSTTCIILLYLERMCSPFDNFLCSCVCVLEFARKIIQY